MPTTADGCRHREKETARGARKGAARRKRSRAGARPCPRTPRGGATSRSAPPRRSSRSATTPAGPRPERWRSAPSPGGTPEPSRPATERAGVRSPASSAARPPNRPQAARMSLALDAGDIAELSDWPRPAGFPHADTWISALFAGCPHMGHGAEPATTYAGLWVLWLGSLAERGSLRRLERARRRPPDRGARAPRQPACRDLLRGAWALPADLAPGRHDRGSRRRRRQPDRGRLAEPVPDAPGNARRPPGASDPRRPPAPEWRCDCLEAV